MRTWDLPQKERSSGVKRSSGRSSWVLTDGAISVGAHHLAWLTFQLPRNAGCVSEQSAHRGDLTAAALFLLVTSVLTGELRRRLAVLDSKLSGIQKKLKGIECGVMLG